jgi:hypothetical protein
VTDATGAFVRFGDAVHPYVSFTHPPAAAPARDDPAETLASMRRELEGVERRLEHQQDPGEKRPLDRLAYQQARNELEEYRDTVKRQIRQQEKLVRAAGRP